MRKNRLAALFLAVCLALLAAVPALAAGAGGDVPLNGTVYPPGVTPTPTAAPTAGPTITPTATPAATPTVTPTVTPTALPTAHPTAVPTAGPAATPGTPQSPQPGVAATPGPTAGADAPAAGNNAPPTPAGPAPEESGGGQGGPGEEAAPPELELRAEPGESIRLDEGWIEKSIGTGAGLAVTLTGQDGSRLNITIPAFTSHDQALLGGHGLEIGLVNNAAQLTVTVSGSATDGVRSAGIPHSIVQAALQNDLPVKVVFTDVGRELTLQKGFFNEASLTDCDLSVEHAEAADQFTLAYQKGTSHPAPGLTVHAAAFQKAAEEGLALRADIRDPEQEEALWYSWSFDPQDLQGAQAADVDLHVSGEAPKGDAIRQQLEGKKAQYLVFSHHGPLPAPASLTVHKSSFRPRDKVDLVYSNPETGELETVYQGLKVQDNGAVQVGVIDHCSSYALVRTGPPAWLWMALAVLAAALLGAGAAAILMFGRKKSSREVMQ